MKTLAVNTTRLAEETWRQRVDQTPAQPDEFARLALAIVESIEQHRDEHGLNEAISQAKEDLVDALTNQELKHFGEVVVGARRQAKLQEWLDADRDKLHSGQLDHQERVSVGHQYEALRHEACEYNHHLRSVIELSGHHFDREDLTNWLVDVSQGRHEWAVAEIQGAVSEVALHAALQGVPELAGVRYGSVAEDLAGYDFIAELNGKLLTVDAKTGKYWPLDERKHGHRHLEVSVPHEAVNGFWIKRPAMDRLRTEIRQALQIPHHVEHSWRLTPVQA